MVIYIMGNNPCLNMGLKFLEIMYCNTFRLRFRAVRNVGGSGDAIPRI